MRVKYNAEGVNGVQEVFVIQEEVAQHGRQVHHRLYLSSTFEVWTKSFCFVSITNYTILFALIAWPLIEDVVKRMIVFNRILMNRGRDAKRAGLFALVFCVGWLPVYSFNILWPLSQQHL